MGEEVAAQGGRRGVFIPRPPPKNRAVGEIWGRIIRPKYGPDNPAPPDYLVQAKYPVKNPADIQWLRNLSP